MMRINQRSYTAVVDVVSLDTIEKLVRIILYGAKKINHLCVTQGFNVSLRWLIQSRAIMAQFEIFFRCMTILIAIMQAILMGKI